MVLIDVSIHEPDNNIEFDDLDLGEWFLYKGDLYIKRTDDDACNVKYSNLQPFGPSDIVIKVGYIKIEVQKK